MRITWRERRIAGVAAAACLNLAGCGLIEKEMGLVAAPPVPDPRDERIAALETELAAAAGENAELQKKLAEVEKAARTAALAEGAALEPPTLKEDTPIVPTAEAASIEPPPEIRPETVVAAADADRALAGAPAKPVETSPRLVQPTFASQEAVFENEAGDGIETASVLFGVHLASYRHTDEARAGWVKLQRDFPDALGLLEPRLERVEIEGKGEFLRLIGGGFASEEKAAALCATLKSAGVYCAVAGFEGERLSFAENRSG